MKMIVWSGRIRVGIEIAFESIVNATPAPSEKPSQTCRLASSSSHIAHRTRSVLICAIFLRLLLQSRERSGHRWHPNVCCVNLVFTTFFFFNFSNSTRCLHRKSISVQFDSLHSTHCKLKTPSLERNVDCPKYRCKNFIPSIRCWNWSSCRGTHTPLEWERVQEQQKTGRQLCECSLSIVCLFSSTLLNWTQWNDVEKDRVSV